MTTLGDDFSRSDNTDLNAANTGKTLNGSAATWQWNELDGLLSIVSEGLENNAASFGDLARVEQDLAGNDHVVTADLFNNISGSNVGIMARFSASAKTGYLFLCTNSSGSILYKVIAGVFTSIGTSGTSIVNETKAASLSCIGSNIVCKLNGSEVINVTDTAVPTGLRVGVYLGANGANRCRVDNFYAEDVGGGGGEDPSTRQLFIPRLYGPIVQPIGGAGMVII